MRSALCSLRPALCSIHSADVEFCKKNDKYGLYEKADEGMLKHLAGFDEVYDSIIKARDKERRIKAGSRAKKIKSIEEMNPEWKDLYSDI